MPTYEYECEDCKSKFEVNLPISAPVEHKCELCGSEKTIRLISGGGGFILKGAGFYVNDYGKVVKSDGIGSKEKDPNYSKKIANKAVSNSSKKKK
jgi:putative FmdB family regulatory protein